MEYETPKSQSKLIEILGSSSDVDDHKIGIINETEHWIYRRGLDYLLVGLVTDIDLDESERENRYEQYLDTITADLRQYRTDVKEWDAAQKENTSSDSWQTNYYNRERRKDLPPVEVCERSIIGAAAQNQPTRDEIKLIANEGLDVYIDTALDSAYAILTEQLSVQISDLVAANVHLQELKEKQSKSIHSLSVLTVFREAILKEMADIQSRLSAVEDIQNYRTPNRHEKLTQVPAIEDSHTLRDELSPIIPESAKKIGSKIVAIATSLTIHPDYSDQEKITS